MERDDTSRSIILSDAAKVHIKACTGAGMYKNRVDTQGPHFMAPSADAELYSMVSAIFIGLM